MIPEAIQQDAAALCALLTDRERDTLIYSAKGLNAFHIADMLGCKPRTVENYRAGIMRKLDVSSLIEAAVIAAKAGIV
jgi:two-component system response regulator FixJ